uniref:killer cell lectin-like receptor subfamily E member 1 isoform X2 n=1 Tax=Myodes glareolus TaxID=447135 RepID=UPI0020213D3B|nr:killer cell lectin-like receptor subfamily E member 1 isoform X2 [Myodes glareolus]
MKMNEVPLTCSTLNVKSQQKCKAKKNVKNTFHSNESSFIEQREKHQKHKKHKNTADDISGEVSSERTSPATQQNGLQHPCPENWVWFRCSCYHFSKEELSWRESQLACLSLNSSLIRISREEMDFFHLESFFWVGVYYNGTSKQWQWENHSVLSSGTFCGFKTYMQEDSCASYKSKETCYPENCANKLKYICKKYHI